MNERSRPPQRDLEHWLAQAAHQFPYPPTPTIEQWIAQGFTQPAQAGNNQRLRRVGAMVLLLIMLGVGLLAVPPVRAAILEFLQIGAVRIWLVPPDPTPTPIPSRPPLTSVPPLPTDKPLASVLDLAGETTLPLAQGVVHFPVRLPTYPPDLGPPDKVYLQDLDGSAVILVWLQSDQPEQVRMSLHYLSSQAMVWKLEPQILAETTVRGQRAVWVEGPYVIQIRNRDYDLVRLVQGHVLVWTAGDVTYRLETDVALAEAIRVAESLQ